MGPERPVGLVRQEASQMLLLPPLAGVLEEGVLAVAEYPTIQQQGSPRLDGLGADAQEGAAEPG